jgi:hypothetical protein
LDKYIGEKFEAMRKHAWARSDERYLRLAKLDAILDGEFYECLMYPFYQETTAGDGAGDYIPIRDRRPSFRYNLPNMLSNQLGRKLFGGPNAPALTHEKESVRQKFDALKEECCLEVKQLESIHWGSSGSAAAIIQIVPFESGGKKLSKAVVTNYRAKNCTPTFNKLGELSRIWIHYPVTGADYLYMDEPITEDWEGKPIEGEESYWYVMELTSKHERVYKPIKLTDWAPMKGKNAMFDVFQTEVVHDLGFVPAHWYQYRTGKLRPHDGVCYWEPSIPNIIDLEYTVSQIGSGIRYNAVPQVVVQGNVVKTNAQDGGLGRGASRFIQQENDVKDGDHEEKGNRVYMLEAQGTGMSVGLRDWAPLVLRVAMQQICASLKDPNKVTTAMSGKGMEVLESEFLDLAKELRTVFGDNGYLKLLKKIAMACKLKNHVLMKDVSIEDIDALTLTWPPLTSIGMIEFQAMCMGLAQLVENQIMNAQECRDYALGQIDMPVVSANKDYLPSVGTPEQSALPDVTQTGKSGDITGDEPKLVGLADAGAQMAEAGPINTKYRS